MAQEEQLGLMHPETLRSMHGLAVVYFKLGKYDLAENLLIPCLSGRRQKLGAEVGVGHVPCVAFSSTLIVIVHPSSPPLLTSLLPRVRAPFCVAGPGDVGDGGGVEGLGRRVATVAEESRPGAY